MTHDFHSSQQDSSVTKSPIWETSETHTNERRAFLKTLVAGSGTILLGGSIYGIFELIAPNTNKQRIASPLTLDLSTVQSEISLARLGTKPIIIFRNTSFFEVFSLKCPHAGCPVEYKSHIKEFWCSCHGGKFARDGSVIAGPPTKPLQKLKVEQSSHSLTILDESV